MPTNKPTDSQIVTHALALLRAGILSSNLPNRLMDEFGISAAQAKELASVAIKRKKVETQ